MIGCGEEVFCSFHATVTNEKKKTKHSSVCIFTQCRRLMHIGGSLAYCLPNENDYFRILITWAEIFIIILMPTL